MTTPHNPPSPHAASSKRNQIMPFICGAAVTLAATLLIAQTTVQQPLRTGRYQAFQNRGSAYILDTATGEMWARNERTVELFGTPERPDYRSYEVADR